MHISKMIDYVKNEINFSEEFCEGNVFVTLRIEPILKIIENLERSHKDILEVTEENKKKDKIIDLILDKINENYNNTFNSDEVKEIIEIYENIKDKNKLKGLDLRKDCIKQYFERKVEEER